MDSEGQAPEQVVQLVRKTSDFKYLFRLKSSADLFVFIYCPCF